jgi:hypothetical protein
MGLGSPVASALRWAAACSLTACAGIEGPRSTSPSASDDGGVQRDDAGDDAQPPGGDDGLADCIWKLEAPDQLLGPPQPNLTMQGGGGFYVDDAGMVLSAKIGIVSGAPGGQVTTLQSYAYGPPPLVADATNAYFFALPPPTYGPIQSVPRGGGAPTALYWPAKDSYIGAIVQDSTYLYFVENDAIRRLPKSGGSTTTISLKGAGGLFLDGTMLYLLSDSIETMDVGAPASRAPFATMVTTVTSQDGVRRIPVNATSFAEASGVVVLTLELGSTSPPRPYGLYTIRKGATQVLVDESGRAPMIVDGDNVYYRAGSALNRFSIGTSTSATLIPNVGDGGVLALAATSDALYFATTHAVCKTAK